MTAFQPIPHQDIDAAAALRLIRKCLSEAMVAAEAVPDGQRMLGEALCAVLDTAGGGAPSYEPFGNLRDEAEWWADIATPLEIEAIVGASLRRINRATFAPRARKRLFNSLWRSFSPEERAAFLAAATEREG